MSVAVPYRLTKTNIKGRVLSHVVQLQTEILMGTQRGVPYCPITKTNIDGKEGWTESRNFLSPTGEIPPCFSAEGSLFIQQQTKYTFSDKNIDSSNVCCCPNVPHCLNTNSNGKEGWT